MNIQIITGNKELESTNTDLVISDYNCPRALDDFEMSIIDLSCEDLWRFQYSDGSLDRNNDLSFISDMVNKSKSAIILYIYPQNVELFYNNKDRGYKNTKQMKAIVRSHEGKLGICNCFPNNVEARIMYEPTSTSINNKEYKADFHFESDWLEVITESEKSNKPTTIHHYNRIYLTTLDICKSIGELENYIRFVFEKKQNDDLPEWVTEYTFGNDIEQKEIIKRSNDLFFASPFCRKLQNKNVGCCKTVL